jgi:hypothetical protein
MTLEKISERADFWFICIISFTVIGSVRMLDENSTLFSKGSEEIEEDIEGGYNAFEVVGALTFGLLIIFVRKWIRPSMLICV